MRALLIIVVLSIILSGQASAQNSYSLNIFGPGYGLSINRGYNYPQNFYFNMTQPMIYAQPIIMQYQSVDLVACNNNLYKDVDQFGNQVSPLYKICWEIDRYSNQISAPFKQF